MSLPTVVIADDHPMIRDGLAQTLAAAGLKVVGEAKDGLQAIALAKALKPDMLTLDLSMPGAQGIEVLVEVRRWSPDTKVLVFSGVNSEGAFRQVVAAKAEGVLLKDGPIELLSEAIPKILAGQRVIAREVTSRIAEDGLSDQTLTLREHQILNMLSQGLSNKKIAARLGVSVKTVDNHRTNLMRKLEVHSLAELLALALREGLLDS